uniref:Uncharacterized protein n=1 Tax=Helianthus annuus TaxID=4232 RepID=A0A251UU07_HELAN
MWVPLMLSFFLWEKEGAGEKNGQRSERMEDGSRPRCRWWMVLVSEDGWVGNHRKPRRRR